MLVVVDVESTTFFLLFSSEGAQRVCQRLNDVAVTYRRLQSGRSRKADKREARKSVTRQCGAQWCADRWQVKVRGEGGEKGTKGLGRNII